MATSCYYCQKLFARERGAHQSIGVRLPMRWREADEPYHRSANAASL